MKILLVEDDQATAAVLSEVFMAQYYTVDIATDGEIGLQLATSWDYDLILTDLIIPKLDGISLCRQLRSTGCQKPILLITAKDSSADVVKGLDAGADDYVTKPYDLSELLARMRALLRRREHALAPTVLTWEHLCVNPVSAEVTYRGKRILLSPKQYTLLGFFLRNPQRIFSRSDIIDRLWSIDACPGEAVVTNLIKDLRQRLKAAGMQHDLLETIYGLGYRLKPPPKFESTPHLLGASSGIESSPPRKKRKPRGLASVTAVLKQYQSTFVERLDIFEQVKQAFQDGRLHAEQQQQAAGEAHKLAGTLGSFGYRRGSTLALAIEQMLLKEQPLTASDLDHFSTLLADLTDELTRPPAPLSVEMPDADEMISVFVIDSDPAFTAALETQAIAFGVRLELSTQGAIAPQHPPQSIVLSLHESSADRLSRLKDLSAQFPAVPILVITDQDSLSDRVALSRLGIHQFLYRPIEPAAVLKAIQSSLKFPSAQRCPKPQSQAATVMILDDDPPMLDILRELLQPWGLHVITLQDPQQFWDVLTQTQPDLLVMDLEMPLFSGLDLCRVVRQDPRWGNLPILVVTAHTDIESVQQVFAAGADDFIGKPVVGPELVTRVISRIDRTQLQQELETMKRRIGA